MLTASSARTDGPGSALPCFSGRFDNPAMAFCVFDFCHCVLIPSTARTFRATYEGQRPMADDVPDRKAAISAAAVRSDLLSSTTLEHAETITRQRYGVKDYFPRESSIMKSWINAPCAAGAISPLAAKNFKRQPWLLHEQGIVPEHPQWPAPMSR